MNREILFRGKRIDNGEWVYGDYHKFTCTTSGITPTPTHYIMGTDVNFKGQTWVDPDTIGQYIGLTDKNGVKIFEGDIISYNGSKSTVRFDTSLNIPCFTTGIGGGSSTGLHPYKISKRHVVIGNIHDNPELLEGNDGTDD